ncbi:hypothetical protein GTW71_13600 [Streptomyces sp. SID6041]|nr:hypothetical protein [Streptomyces sp. SID6041]
MEAYALNEVTISKLLNVAIGAPPAVSAEELIKAIRPALITLFLIRLCLRESSTGTSLTAKSLAKWDINDNSMERVIEAFRLALNSLPVPERNGQTPESLLGRYEEYRKRLSEDTRHFANGHDISLVIVLYLKCHCAHVFNSDARRPFRVPEVFEVLLMSCIETAEIQKERLFRTLLAWAARDFTG